MDFHPGTKQNEEKKLVEAESRLETECRPEKENPPESKIQNPAISADSAQQLTQSQDINSDISSGISSNAQEMHLPKSSLWGKAADSASSILLILGQLFVVSVIACSSGCLASFCFSLSYERVMYHCGPQDTIMGVFSCLSLPFYWLGWYFPARKKLRLALLATLGALASYVLACTLSGPAALILGLSSFLLLTLFAEAGAYFSSYKQNWPRSFSVTRWLCLLYIPAIALFAYEFANLDMDPLQLDQVSASALLTSASALAAFVTLPCFLSAIRAGSKQFSSALGLNLIGQAPVIVSMFLYTLLNGVMLACFAIFGAETLHNYFAALQGAVMEPDFDLAASNLAELTSKLGCSFILLLYTVFSIWLGSVLGLAFNRMKNSSK